MRVQGVLKSFCVQLSDKTAEKKDFFRFGCKLAICSEKFVQWNFSKKVLFFGKVTLLVINQYWWFFFKQIYIPVLPKQVLSHKKGGKLSFFFLLYWMRKGANIQKYTLLKKLCIAYFPKVTFKLELNNKQKTSRCAFLKNAWYDVFGFFITYNCLITFEKYARHSFVQHCK